MIQLRTDDPERRKREAEDARRLDLHERRDKDDSSAAHSEVDRVQVASEDSFPASDAPGYGNCHA